MNIQEIMNADADGPSASIVQWMTSKPFSPDAVTKRVSIARMNDRNDKRSSSSTSKMRSPVQPGTQQSVDQHEDEPHERKPVMDASDVTIAVITAIASGAAFKTLTVLTTRRTLRARMKPRLMALPASTTEEITTAVQPVPPHGPVRRDRTPGA